MVIVSHYFSITFLIQIFHPNFYVYLCIDPAHVKSYWQWFGQEQAMYYEKLWLSFRKNTGISYRPSFVYEYDKI